MDRIELTAAYEAANKAHGDYYMDVYRPAAAAHLAGEMTSEEYLVIRAKEKELLAAIDPLYNAMAELPEEEEIEVENGEQMEIAF